ncbi:DEAD/DEAH box helicase family protein [Thioalkalicoccus limnaeus]|uniref:DEAD/DEAH box helicase family protein n=1 Tax=Thioalkalicoccus limnaeus TaxID=120681 RepID=A0ABV4BM17_9GAMM
MKGQAMRDGVITEADTCREFVTPRLVEAGWGAAPHVIGEQRSFTDGRIIVAGGKVRRGRQKRADYLLYYRRDYLLAVIEAKEIGLPVEAGVQQAREYAEILGLKFAYATNGHRIIEIDYTTGAEREIDRYPTPDELFARLTAASHLPQEAASHLLEPFNLVSGKVPRYYQRIAIDRVIEAILLGQKRILATLATGTGKTCVAFQICWKLWSSRWNRAGEYRRPKILFLADRNILVDDPMAKMFAPFGDARHKIAGGDVSQGRDMYFGIYQALSTASTDVFRQYRPDFFDLIIIDECHRGSSRDESAWRAVLDYFAPAVQFGLTATPLREESRDSYEYFGNPVYTYSLRQGIEDGFLAPYRVHRVITTVDAAGWRPNKDELDRYGRVVPDDEYQTKDFERVVALRARTRAMARHLTDFLGGTDRFAKTLVFCVDQEHAAEMRQELIHLNSDLVKQYPDFVARVTADEGAIGLTHLAHFQDVDKPAPVILTTSQLLTTGVDAEMVKNVVLARVVGSRAEFKQIVGRGTRLKVDYGKTYFNIIDFTGTATRHFADPNFDGEPARIEEVTVDESGEQVSVTEIEPETPPEPRILEYEVPEEQIGPDTGILINEPSPEPRKFYIDGGRAKPTGRIDIAMMQSLSRQGEVNPLVEDYGQVIVDECHHVGAVSFDAILKRTKAKFVLGLTATPIRRDGQQPIIFMQCGPIRHTAATPAGAPHDLEVVPRASHARIDLPQDAGIQDVFRHLANDQARTAAIAAEVRNAFAQGRKVLVLTERTEHLEAISRSASCRMKACFDTGA